MESQRQYNIMSVTNLATKSKLSFLKVNYLKLKRLKKCQTNVKNLNQRYFLKFIFFVIISLAN